MRKSLIPWHVFLEAIAGQDPGALDSWLERWGFTNDGVVLIRAETHSATSPLSLDLNDNGPANGVGLKIGTSVHNFLLFLRNSGCLLGEETVQLWSHTKEL